MPGTLEKPEDKTGRVILPLFFIFLFFMLFLASYSPPLLPLLSAPIFLRHPPMAVSVALRGVFSDTPRPGFLERTGHLFHVEHVY